MNVLLLRPLSVLLAVCAPAFAGAQNREVPAKSAAPRREASVDSSVSIPRSMMPPAGKCRIWMRGVPAAQQPAPTDCTTALRQSPANGVLVFGPALRELSPFDPRNPWSKTASGAEEGRERTTPRSTNESGRTAQPASTKAQTGNTTVREVPQTRTAPAAREAPPAPRETTPPRKPDPPPKKPEQP